MNKPDIELCEKLVKNLKTLKERDSVFVEGAKKAEKQEKKGDWLLGLPLSSTLTIPARTALMVLITQLGLQSYCNVEAESSTPSFFDALLKNAEETIALFK